MNIRERCEKCNNYYGQNLFDFVENKSAHLKKCGFKIQCNDRTEFIRASVKVKKN